MYDEKIDCKLKPSALMEDRLLNWNRINCKLDFLGKFNCVGFCYSYDLFQLPLVKILLGGTYDEITCQGK